MGDVRVKLSREDLARRAADLPGWQVKNEALLTRSFAFPDFQKGLDFVNRVGAAAEEQGHHPDLHLTWGRVDVEVSTHDAGGITESDFTLAREIDRLYAQP